MSPWISHPTPKSDSDMNHVKKYSAEVERGDARKNNPGAVSLSSSLAVINLIYLFISQGKPLARPLQRQPEVFVRLLQPRENIKHKPQERTVATAALAFIKPRCFCPAETSTSGRSYAITDTVKRRLVRGNVDDTFGILCRPVVFNQGFDNTKHYFGIQDFAEALLLPFIRSKMIETLFCLKEARGELNNMAKLLNGVLHFGEAFRLIKVSRQKQ